MNTTHPDMQTGPGMPADGPIVEVAGLTKVYRGRVAGRGAFRAVDDISFSVAPGESLGIVGESGSGKSTTARLTIGLERPTEGRILIDGVDHTRPPRTARQWRERARLVQIVFQDPYTSLDRRQPIGECLAEAVGLHVKGSRREIAARVTELAALVGIDERQLAALPRALSGGQRQRVAIARALAAEPKVLILDEAVSALDVSIQAQILNLLSDIRERTQVTYLFISHDLAVIRQIADTTLVMKNGRVVEAGPTATVLDQPSHPYTQALRSSVPSADWTPETSGSDAP